MQDISKLLVNAGITSVQGWILTNANLSLPTTLVVRNRSQPNWQDEAFRAVLPSAVGWVDPPPEPQTKVPLLLLRDGPPVRRIPLALARRFFQICTSARAEAVTESDLDPARVHGDGLRGPN